MTTTLMPFVLAVLTFNTVAPAKDWPMYGGSPTRNAITTGANPPTRWGLEPSGVGMKPLFNLKWIAQTGHGFSLAAPVISEGFIWLGTNNESPRDPNRTEPAPTLMCFREADGAFIWQYLAPVPKGRRADASWTGIKCSPLVEEDKLWFTTPSAEVICLDIGPLHRGDGMPVELWKLDMNEELGVFVHPMVMAWPGANSVALYDRWIYVNTDNAVDWTHVNIPAPYAPSLVCLAKNTGELVWEDNSPGTNIFHIQWSSPLALNLDGTGTVIAGFGDGWLRAFAAPTGERLWELDCNPPEYRRLRYPSAGGPSEILAAPVFREGRVYVAIGQELEHGEGSGNLVCVEAITGKLIWQNQFIKRSISSVVVANDYVYAADAAGFVYGLDIESGKVRWRYDAQALIWASPLVVNRLLYIGDEDGDATVIDLDRIQERVGTEPLHLDKRSVTRPDERAPSVWVNHMHSPVFASPVYASGTLYWHAGGYLCAIAPLTEQPVETPATNKRKLPSAVFVPTPQDVVDHMLEMARVTDKDKLVDLGSGDGRVVITAARKYGSQSIGYELDPVLVERSLRAVQEHTLENLVHVEQRDLYSADLSSADVVVVFLPGSMLRKLLPQLERLKPGARLVSHEFEIPGIPADETERIISADDGVEHAIHLWTAPLQRLPSP